MSIKIVEVADLVGSVGGSLGLFLGFSCLATAQAILQKM